MRDVDAEGVFRSGSPPAIVILRQDGSLGSKGTADSV